MSFNNKIIICLIWIICILSLLLLINSLYWEINVIESFIISFISGAIVSLFITYVQYKKEKEDIIYYYNNAITEYYQLLNNILQIIKYNNQSIDKKYDMAKAYLNNYLEKQKFSKSIVELNLVFRNKDMQKIYQELYEYTKGIYLMKYFFKPSKNMLKQLISFCNEHINIIDEGMILLTEVFKINYPWKELKKYIINS